MKNKYDFSFTKHIINMAFKFERISEGDALIFVIKNKDDHAKIDKLMLEYMVDYEILFQKYVDGDESVSEHIFMDDIPVPKFKPYIRRGDYLNFIEKNEKINLAHLLGKIIRGGTI